MHEHQSRSDHTSGPDQLALYYSPICAFCVRVIRVIEKLGVDVEMRNTLQVPANYNDLVEARGRATVPVLWIKSADGSVHWMPESEDIMDYLLNVTAEPALALRSPHQFHQGHHG